MTDGDPVDIDTLDIDINDEVTAYYERTDQRVKLGATYEEADTAEVAEFARSLAQAAARWQWIAEDPRFFEDSDWDDYADLDEAVAHLSDDELEWILVKYTFLHDQMAVLWELFRRALAIRKACFGGQLPFEQVKDSMTVLTEKGYTKEYRQADIEAALGRQRPN